MALDNHAAIREQGREEAYRLAADPFWVAGVVAYWAEGTKTLRDVRFANSDPNMVRLFVRWARTYLDVDGRGLSAKLHLHSGQDDEERKTFWSQLTGIPRDRFSKTYVKSEGTGHRKNRLYNGTITVRLCRSGEDIDRIFGWIDGLSDMWGVDTLWLGVKGR